MITLFHAAKSRSVRVRWLLEELGVPYEVKTLTFTPDSLKGAEYAKVNPLGRVPAIVDGDVTMFESGAIVEWLLEQYGQGRLAPKPGSPTRPAYLQWFHFAEGTALPPLSDFVQHAFLRPEAQRIPAMVPDAQRRAAEWLDVVEQALAGKTWITGEEFTAADVMLGYALGLAQLVGMVGDRPNVTAYLARCAARAAFQKANAE
jgi:glutathione S-transferase